MQTPRPIRLPNGLTLVVVEAPHHHQELVSLTVRVGSRFETPAESGLSHLLEHTLFRGNAAHPDVYAIFRGFEETGEAINAETGVETTDYFQAAHPRHLSRALEHLAAFVRTPTFRELEKERRVILDEILYDYNEAGDLIRLDAVAAELLWPGHPLAQTVTGTRSTVETFTAEAVRRHYERHYRPANAVLALAGPVAGEHAEAMARAHFADWPADGGAAAPVPALRGPGPFGGPRLRTVHDHDSQVRVQLSFPTTGYRHPDEVGLGLLASVLDDGPTTRLQRALREEAALVYSVGCAYTGYVDVGQVDVVTAAPPGRLEAVLDRLLELLREVRRGGVTVGEVEAARRRYRFGLEFGQDSLEAALDRFGWPVLFDAVRSEAAERERIDALDAGELSRLAAGVFAPERLHGVLIGPVGDAEKAAAWRCLERYARP